MSRRTKFLILLDLAITSLVFYVLFRHSFPHLAPAKLGGYFMTCLVSTVFINAMTISPAAFFLHTLFKTIETGKSAAALFRAVIPASACALAGIIVILPFAWLGGTDARALASYFFTPILGTLFAASAAGLAIRAVRSRGPAGSAILFLLRPLSAVLERGRFAEKPIRALLALLTIIFPLLALYYGLFPGGGKSVSAAVKRAWESTRTPEQRLESLSAALSSPDRRTRLDALREMESFGIPAIPFLVRAVREDLDAETLKSVIRALGNFSWKTRMDETVPALEKVLYWKLEKPGNAVSDVRVDALCALMRFGTDQAHGAIATFQRALEEKALHDPDESQRTQSIAWLGYFGPSEVQFLVKAIREEDMACAAAAVRTLGEMGYYAGAAVPGLKKTLRWRNQYFPYETFCALKKIGTTAALDAFKEWKREIPVPALKDDCFSLSVYDGGPPRALECLSGKWSGRALAEEWRRGQESEGDGN